MARKVLRPHQDEAIKRLRLSILRGNRKPLLQVPTGGGKCLGIGTPVLRYDGSVVPVEEVRVGDLLMGPDSTPRRVLSTCRDRGQLYRVVPIKGDPWVCNDVHILTLVQSQTGAIVDISISDYLSRTATFRALHKQFQPENGVEFGIQADPTFPPYFLGLWIGDGTKRLAGVGISKPDQEVIDEVHRVAHAYGCRVRREDRAVGNGSCPTFHLVTPRGQNNPLLTELRNIMAGGSISRSVLTASRGYRMEVLAGCLDTDGYLHKGGFEITQKSPALAWGIAFLARSLGYRVSWVVKWVNGQPYQRLNITGHTDQIPTRIPRKQAPPRRQVKNHSRTGFKIEAIGEGEYAGFELDGDGRFLLGDFTVTHNTVIASSLIHGCLAKGKRAIFVVPSLSLIGQTVERLAEDGITCVGVIQADHPETDATRPVQVASVQTLLNRSLTGRVEKARRRRSIGMRDESGRVLYEDKPQEDGTTKRVMVRETVEKDVDLEPIPLCDLVVLDEAHVSFDLYLEWMNHPAWAKVPFIGLSATPWTKGLGTVFDDLIRPISMQELIDQDFLSPFRVFAPTHPDLSKVRVRVGEYVEEDLEGVMNKPQLVADVIESWKKLGNNEPTVCFAVNRVHAKTLQDEFQAAGIGAAYADAFTSREERDAILAQFRSGEVKVLCNVDIYSKGFDEDVRCISLCRPTKSEMWFVQAVGRALRTAKGKSIATIIDHSDNHLRMGFVTDIDHEELDDGSKAKKETKQQDVEERLPKECASCHALRPPGMKACPVCGFHPTPKSDITCEEGELVEMKRSPKQKNAMTREEAQNWWSMCLGLQQERGKREGWASHLYKEKCGVWPRGLVDFPLPPNDEVKRFAQHRNMKRAFGRAKAFA